MRLLFVIALALSATGASCTVDNLPAEIGDMCLAMAEAHCPRYSECISPEPNVATCMAEFLTECCAGDGSCEQRIVLEDMEECCDDLADQQCGPAYNREKPRSCIGIARVCRDRECMDVGPPL